jgi:hypothetical protein
MKVSDIALVKCLQYLINGQDKTTTQKYPV